MIMVLIAVVEQFLQPKLGEIWEGKERQRSRQPLDKVQSPPINAGGNGTRVWWGLSAGSGASASTAWCRQITSRGTKP